MDQKNRQTHHQTKRMTSRGRSASPEYYVDLTVDLPLNHSMKSPPTRSGILRLNQSNREAQSSQITSSQASEGEWIDCSNRLLPPKKRSRKDKDAKATAIINLDDTSPQNEAAQINDSTSGGSNVLSCPICFEYLTSKRKPTSTRCGHVYCLECIEQTLATSKKCPKCQTNITKKSCIRLYF